jgi:hypothetical protein
MTRLIDAQFVKDFTTMDNNIQNTLIVPIITMAQVTHIQLALGSELYFKILDDFENNNLSGKYEELFEYIKPCLAEYVYYYAVPKLAIRLTNKGANRNFSEDSNTASIAELKFLQNNVLNTAEFYLKRLNTFLKDNRNEFPELKVQDQNPKKNNTSFFSGMYIPK